MKEKEYECRINFDNISEKDLKEYKFKKILYNKIIVVLPIMEFILVIISCIFSKYPSAVGILGIIIIIILGISILCNDPTIFSWYNDYIHFTNIILENPHVKFTLNNTLQLLYVYKDPLNINDINTNIVYLDNTILLKQWDNQYAELKFEKNKDNKINLILYVPSATEYLL